MTNKTKLLFLVIAFAGIFTSCKSQSTATKNYKGNIVKTQGKQILDSNGNPIILKGTNLGNWLVPEGYMFKMGQGVAEK